MWRRLIYHPEVNYALRQTLVLCLPVAVGLIFGHLQQGLLFSLVPACCNIAGLDTPHKRFFKRLTIGGCLFAGCSLAVQLLLARDIPLPLILTVLAMTLGVTAEISALHARLLPASLIAAIFTLSLAGNMPVWEPLLLYTLGTLWYGLFNWFWFWMWREQPLRESLSVLYQQLADYCEAKYTLLTQHTDPEKSLPPLLARQQKVVDLISLCYQQLHMLAANRNHEYKRLMGVALHLPKPYWILMTVLLVTQNGYSATRVRILHRAAGTLAGLIIAGVTLHFHVPEGYTLAGMLMVTLVSYLIIRKSYGWATVGFTVTAVYTLQLLTLNGEQFIIARLADTLIGCLIAFGGMVWLWPQWQSGLLRQNAHDALEADQEAIRLILSDDPQPTPLAWQRMKVNQAHNALFNSLNQAMQEPGFNSAYLADMKLWVTHSQFIVEHINAMTTLAREHTMLTPDLAQRYLQSCEIALQRCQQRLEYDAPGESGDSNILEAPETLTQGPMSTLEQHLQRVLGHLNTMHTISSVAWRQRPHHGIWLIRRLKRTPY
ncbi:FUSC family membrane protein [Leclercia adecarboxylata]|uniref:FUSC family membrane protein n=1 Tax=Leclercia adecarboxylata TaxID=83655 RepID=UPI00384F0E60